jgi:radical SAM-linked protein
MLSVFQRASVRAGLNLRYSQGFNPRPKISLPLPRPVGIESDEEILVLSPIEYPAEVSYYRQNSVIHSFKDLSVQLPQGCELLSINIVRKKPAFQSCIAAYEFTIHRQYFNKKLKNMINRLTASESLIVERPIDMKGRLGRKRPVIKKYPGEELNQSRIKKIDVRDFIKSVETKENCIIVVTKITPKGTIRIQEIMELLELDNEKLACPIKRTNMQWEKDKN